MNATLSEPSRWTARLANLLLDRARPVLTAALLLVVAALLGLRLAPQSPESAAPPPGGQTPSAQDGIRFGLATVGGDVGRERFLEAVQWLAERSWRIPGARRVESIANLRRLESVGVAAVGEAPARESAEASPRADGAEEARGFLAAAEPAFGSLRAAAWAGGGQDERARPAAGYATSVDIELASGAGARSSALAEARNAAADFQRRFPAVAIRLAGEVEPTGALDKPIRREAEAAATAGFAALLAVAAVLLRSVAGALLVGGASLLAAGAALGVSAWSGYGSGAAGVAAAVVAVMLAAGNGIHFLGAFLAELRQGAARRAAIVESIRINFWPVLLTSSVAVAGFLALGSSGSGALAQLGRASALAVAVAWALAAVALPAALSLLPFAPRAAASPCRRGGRCGRSAPRHPACASAESVPC